MRPRSEDELCQAVRAAARDGLSLRVAGAGHSFTPLCATDGVLVSLEHLAAIEKVDPARGRATIQAGGRLGAPGEPLLAAGLALENQGDIDRQALAGALATGTHGTGRTLPNLSARVAALRLVTAQGEPRTLSHDDAPELLRAARVSLGLLGVISAVELELLPAYRLHERVWREDADRCLSNLEERVQANRHFEFFWYPPRDLCELKTLNPTDAPPDELPGREGERIGWSCHIISSLREMRFHEMEYSVPAEAGPDCFRALRERMRARHGDVAWPVEYRTLAADDADLSPAHGRATVTISVHQDARLPHRAFFRDVEPILAEAGGRPHWGKVHGLDRRSLAARYPRYDAFCATRRRLDPLGRFLNPYLASLFS